MNTWLKKMMVALLTLGIGQAAWADDTLNVEEVAQKEMLQLAEAGDVELQFSLGVMYEHGEGVRQDYARAAEWFLKAAEQGTATAQFNLGLMYETGRGVRQDYVQTLQLWHKAARQGVAEAQSGLGWMYYTGRGVRQNSVIAKEWYKKACDNGFQDGCDAYRKLNNEGH